VTGATLVPIEGSNGNEVEIFFDQDSIEIGGPVVISVFETTKGGVVSETEAFEVMVSPFVITVSGPAVAVSSGTWSSTFSTPHDDGATYDWSVIGASGTITDNEDGTADILWATNATDVAGVGVRCVKTYLSLQSVADTAMIDLVGFVAKTRDDFIGTFTGTEINTAGDPDEFVTITTVAEGTDEINLPGTIGGTPALFSSIFVGWGEVIEAGFGDEGDIF
jgi:hypothetical protein